jgi:hypothetical protein
MRDAVAWALHGAALAAFCEAFSLESLSSIAKSVAEQSAVTATRFVNPRDPTFMSP